MEISEKIIYQINSAVNACNGRISCGAEVDTAFVWLQDELEQIYKGEEVYEDECENSEDNEDEIFSTESRFLTDEQQKLINDDQ